MRMFFNEKHKDEYLAIHSFELQDNHFLYSARNRVRGIYQVYALEHTEKLACDIAMLNGYQYIEGFHNEKH